MSGITPFPAACRLAVRIPLLSLASRPYNQDIIPGAQNEREGDAHAGEAVLGRRSLTGRFVVSP